MTKTISLFATAAAALALSAPAFADGPEHFTDRGITYDYSVVTDGRGKVITGTADGAPFVLRVRGTRVSGLMDRKSVWFSTENLRHLEPTPVVETANR